jgi:hypothetical protein
MARRVAGCVAAGSLALMVGGLILAYLNRHLVPASMTNWDFSDVFGDVVNMALPVAGFVLASRRPGNRIGWLALTAGLTLGLSSFTGQYEQRALVAAPGSLPAGPAALWVSTWIWPISLAMLAFLLLLFPTGRLRSRRWRPAAWFVGAVFALTTAAIMVAAFAARLKDAVDLDAVQADLASVVQRALEPAHVAMWTDNSGQERG